VYDRNGEHARFIPELLRRSGKDVNASSSYSGGKGASSNDDGVNWSNFVYHANTIAQIFEEDEDESMHNIKSVFHDNERQDEWAIGQYATDRDKSLSLTHCRAELASLYGIVNVLISDTDEFIYCDRAKKESFGQGEWATPEAQREYIEQSISSLQSQEYLVMRHKQRVLVNASDLYPRDCVKAKIEANESIFGCWGPHRYLVQHHALKVDIHNKSATDLALTHTHTHTNTRTHTHSHTHTHKTFSLGYKCPNTHYHESSNCNNAYRSFDCGNEKTDEGKCELLHLVTNKAFYVHPCCDAQNYPHHITRNISNNELYQITIASTLRKNSSKRG